MPRKTISKGMYYDTKLIISVQRQASFLDRGRLRQDKRDNTTTFLNIKRGIHGSGCNTEIPPG